MARLEHETDGPPVVLGAGGVVLDPDGRVLVIHHRNGNWVFPKGHIEPDEQPLQTALREVLEETGVDAWCPEPGRVFTTEYVNDRGEHRRITYFVLRSAEGEPLMPEETFPEGAFLEPAEALQRLSFEEDRALLRRVLESEGP